MAMNATPEIRPWQRLLQNPVAVKELRSRMRGRRAFVVLTLYLLLMSSLISLVYLAYAASSGPGSVAAREVGKAVFAAVLSVEVFLVIFVGPAFTAGAITGEKERQTYDLLRTTLLPASAVVLGKLISSLSYVILLIVASIPLQSIAFLLGGLSLSELVIAQLLIVVAAVAYALFGLYCSSVMPTTLAATVTTFAGAAFMTLGVPLIAFLFAVALGQSLLSSGSLLMDALLQYGVLIFSATNLPATLIVSDLILLQENTLFFFRQASAGMTLWLFSPWPLFIIVHALGALLLYTLTVQRVRRAVEA